MRTNSTLAIIATLALSSVGHAEPLSASKDASDRSLSGEFLNKASGRVTHSAPASTVLKQVHDRIGATGLLKQMLNGQKFAWKEEAHPRFRRSILKRVLASGESPLDPSEELARWRKQAPVDPTDLVKHAQQVVAAIKAGGMLSEEEVVPMRTTPQVLMFWDKDTQESVVMGHRLQMQRYVGGVPVQGPEGELAMRFDASGELLECELPTEEYHVTKSALSTLSGSATLDKLFKRAGFNHAPKAIQERLTASGKESSVEDVKCGYLDDDPDGSKPLTRGCLVRTTESGASRIQVLQVAPGDE